MQAGAEKACVTLKQGRAWGQGATGEMGQPQQAGPRTGQGQPLNGEGAETEAELDRANPQISPRSNYSRISFFRNSEMQVLNARSIIAGLEAAILWKRCVILRVSQCTGGQACPRLVGDPL